MPDNQKDDPTSGDGLTFRSAQFLPASVDEKARTVEIVWTTGARAERWHPTIGRFIEELEVSAEAMDLRRLNAGAPFLNAHTGGNDARTVMGAIVQGSAHIAQGEAGPEGRAIVQFDDAENDPDAEKIFRKIGKRILTGTSVGYRVLEMKKTKEEVNGVPVYRATKWEPVEVSVAPIPVDLGSLFRNTNIMPDKIDQTTDGASEKAPIETRTVPSGNQAIDVDAVRTQAIDSERARVTKIQAACQRAKLGDEFSNKLVTEGVSIDAARAAILDAICTRDASEPKAVGVTSGGVDLGTNHFRSGLMNAIEHRAFGETLSDEGREFAGRSLLEIAREHLKLRGISVTGMGSEDIARMALNVRSGLHSTSDFPEVMGNVARKRLRKSYSEMPQTYQAIGRKTSLPDFKATTLVQFGDAPSLAKVIEGGEYTRGTIGEGTTSYQLAKYGKIFAYTWEMMVNDDLRVLEKLPGMFASRARELEGDLVWEQFLDNTVAMGDSVVPYHATHGNLTTGTISVATVGAMRALMRKQTGLDGMRINVAPVALIVGTARETLAEQFVAQNQPTQTSEVNPFSGKLSVITEPRLDDYDSGVAFYATANPGLVDIVEYAYLAGNEGPTLESRESFDVDGIELKCRLVFAAKLIDYRGAVKSSGA